MRKPLKYICSVLLAVFPVLYQGANEVATQPISETDQTQVRSTLQPDANLPVQAEARHGRLALILY